MTYYKKCTLTYLNGNTETIPSFTGKTEHQWRNYLVREQGRNLNNISLTFSDPIIPDDTLTSVPRKIGG